MRKIIELVILSAIIIMIGAVAFPGAAFGQNGAITKQAQLLKAEADLKLLDKKIEQARKDRKINKLAELKDLKRREMQWLKELKMQLGMSLSPEVSWKSALKNDPKSKNNMVKQVQKSSEEAQGTTAEALQEEKLQTAGNKNVFQAGGGFVGGALMVGVGYSVPKGEDVNLLFEGGYGLGSQYSVLALGVGGVFPLMENYIGLELSLVNYSERVAEVLGMGAVDRGPRFGIGVFAGKPVGPVQVQIGFNSALGLMAEAIYKF